MAIVTMMGHLSDAATHLPMVTQAVLDSIHHGVTSGGHDQAGHLILVDDAPVTADQLREKLKNVDLKPNEANWAIWLATHFIGMFQQGGQVFVGFVTGIIPTLVVLMTAFYALTGLIGEDRVHGAAQWAGKYAFTRYSILPLISVFFLTNPMAYTFGSFLKERHKPAFYDSAVSFVHPPLGLFPHVNPGEYFVWGGVLVALQTLRDAGKLDGGFIVTLAVWYFIVGLIVIVAKGYVTEWITNILARRQGVDLDSL
jgi:glucitol/sorbitol PTS system EIIC component